MDFELAQKIKYEYELEQLNKTFQEKYTEQQKHTVEVSAHQDVSQYTATIDLFVTNDVTITGMQFDIIVPANVNITAFNLTERTLEFKTIVNQYYTDPFSMTHVFLSSDKSIGIVGGEGSILTICLEGANHQPLANINVTIQNISVTVAEPVIYNKDNISVKL